MSCGEARRRGGGWILNRKRKFRDSPVWDMCPDTYEGAQELVIGGGMRPYIDYTRSTRHRWHWKEYTPIPARLEIGDPIETGMILIEPNLKRGAPPGKQWGRWNELEGFDFIQIGPAGTRVIPGVEYIETPTLLDAFRVLAGCRAAILPEGGLHHACAALGVPAVVLYGAYITPRQTGYAGQIPLWVNDRKAQGWRIPNEHLTRAWGFITPDIVLHELQRLLDEMSQGRMAPRLGAALNQDALPRLETVHGTA